jgi:hypothetical protein
MLQLGSAGLGSKGEFGPVTVWLVVAATFGRVAWWLGKARQAEAARACDGMSRSVEVWWRQSWCRLARLQRHGVTRPAMGGLRRVRQLARVSALARASFFSSERSGGG